MIGGTGGPYEPSNLIFGDGQPAGAVLFVEWQLSSPLPLGGFNLRAIDDGLGGPFPLERSLDHVRLLADTGSGFQPFYEADVDIPYNGTDAQDMLLISETIAPIVAQRFRAEFTQALTCAFCGPRIVELDGFPAETCADGNYDGRTTANDALAALTTSIDLTECPLCACDVDNNGTVTATDARLILSLAVGIPVQVTCRACF